jgi:molybdopterin converting factor subunit 1
MIVKVLFFASCRDIAGCREKDWEIPEGATVGDLKGRLGAAFGGLARLRHSLAVAVNTEYADDSTALSDGDEVALIPPVSGG